MFVNGGRDGCTGKLYALAFSVYINDGYGAACGESYFQGCFYPYRNAHIVVFSSGESFCCSNFNRVVARRKQYKNIVTIAVGRHRFCESGVFIRGINGYSGHDGPIWIDDAAFDVAGG